MPPVAGLRCAGRGRAPVTGAGAGYGGVTPTVAPLPVARPAPPALLRSAPSSSGPFKASLGPAAAVSASRGLNPGEPEDLSTREPENREPEQSWRPMSDLGARLKQARIAKGVHCGHRDGDQDFVVARGARAQ
jgi:hypothetical protein